MKIINYWQQLSKHFIFSHLLLGVIAAGFGFSTNVLALPSTNPAQSPNAMIAVIVKANLQDTSYATVTHHHYQFLSAPRSSIEPFNVSPLIASFILLQTKGYSLANPIRAGPQVTIS
ncbi:hypothetical protein RHO15_01945 [Utexia brackfieldae]|uniref:hypothetical protein n=1 Tax=Utexia brackfieldae TaxID=3074108 RepID=UPI00370DD8BD